MRMLLDTCVILWAVSAPDRLSERARVTLAEEGTEVFASAISTAEIACGCQRGLRSAAATAGARRGSLDVLQARFRCQWAGSA